MGNYVMQIKLASIIDAEPLSTFYAENREHLQCWEPLRDDRYHSISSWKERLIEREKEQEEGKAAYFIAYGENGSIVAVCSLTNIVQGSFQACHMGFAVSELFQGKGVMKQLCIHALDHAFNELGLNRVMANYLPRNSRSAALLNRLGFEKEGVAKKYLKINGQWEDHVLTSLVNPKNT